MSTIVSAENKFVNDYEIDIGAAGLLSINGSSRLDKLKIKMQMYRDLFSAFKVVKTKTTCKNIKKSKTIFFTILMQFKAEKSSVLVFNRFFFFQKRLIRSLTNSSVNLKKKNLRSVNGTLHSRHNNITSALFLEFDAWFKDL